MTGPDIFLAIDDQRVRGCRAVARERTFTAQGVGIGMAQLNAVMVKHTFNGDGLANRAEVDPVRWRRHNCKRVSKEKKPESVSLPRLPESCLGLPHPDRRSGRIPALPYPPLGEFIVGLDRGSKQALFLVACRVAVAPF